VSIICTGLVFLGRNWIANQLLKESLLEGYLAVFAILIPVSALVSFLMSVLTGFQEVASQTVVNSYVRVSLKVLISAGLVVAGLGLTGWIIGEIVAGLVSAVLVVLLVLRIVGTKEFNLQLFGFRSEKAVVGFAATMLGIGVLSYAWAHVSNIILSIYLDAEQIGVYSAAVYVASAIPSLLLAANSIFGPIVAELHERGEKDQLTHLFQTVAKWVIGATWPFAIVILLLSPFVMGIYGEEFIDGSNVLIVLTLGQLVNIGVGSVGIMLLMSGNQRFELMSQALAAVASISLCVLWIPSMGILGAAIARSIAIALANILRLVLVYKLLRLFPYNRGIAKLPLAMAISAGAVLAYSRVPAVASFPIWISIPLGVTLSYCTFFLLIFVQGFDDSEKLLLEAFSQRLRR
jgi:O-antigen/teichoic acid export membrane protein